MLYSRRCKCGKLLSFDEPAENSEIGCKDCNRTYSINEYKYKENKVEHCIIYLEDVTPDFCPLDL